MPVALYSAGQISGHSQSSQQCRSPALLRDAANGAGMGTSIPLSSAGSGHTHTHVLLSNTHTSRGTRAAADLREFVATELVGTE